jgi:ABC-type polysaccharide/polyol phosphate export permease
VVAQRKSRPIAMSEARTGRGVPIPTELRYAEAGWADLVEGAQHWRMWHLMGISELRRRYARSRMGQLWLTLSSGISIAIIGVTWALLWKVPIAEMLPFLAVSIVIWQLLSGIVGDATGVFSANSHYLLSHRIPCALVILALVYRNFLVFLHNALIIAIVFIIFGRTLAPQAFLVLPALLLTAVCAVWCGYIVATLCVRFRDLVHAVQSILQLAFYITPVIWKPEFLSEDYRWLQLLNPFAVYVEIIRAPLLDEPVSASQWLIAAAVAFGGLGLSLSFIGRYKRRILFWV